MKSISSKNAFFIVLLASPVFGAPPPDDSAYKNLSRQAVAAEAAGDCGEAERRFAAAEKEAERFGPGDERVVSSWSNLGGVQEMLAENDRAEASYRRALAALAAAKSLEHKRAGALWHNI